MKQTVVRVVLSSVDIVDIDLLWLSEGRASSGGRNDAELVIRSMCNVFVMICLAFLVCCSGFLCLSTLFSRFQLRDYYEKIEFDWKDNIGK